MELKKHFYWLDFIRFFAAFLVLLAHYRGAFFVDFGSLPESQKNILSTLFFFSTRLGEESVLIFFVMSGFLVGGRAVEKIMKNDVNIAKYVLDRAVRILLPLGASILLVVIIDVVTDNKIPIIDILGSLLSLQGLFTDCYSNAPLWSLAYEVWFYVLMGCIMQMLTGKVIKTQLISFIVLFIVLSFFINFSFIYLFIWFLGAFAYFLHPFYKNSRMVIAILIFTLIGCIFLTQGTSESKASLPKIFSIINKDFAKMLLGLVAALLISQLRNINPTSKVSIYINNLGKRLASFSYSLYLTHYPLMSLLSAMGIPKSSQLDVNSSLYYILSVFVAMIVAYLIYLIAEKNTNSVKKYISLKFNI